MLVLYTVTRDVVSECGAVYNTTEGTIYSPGYPDYYPNNVNCTYDIIGDPHKTMIVKFLAEHFAVGPPRTTSHPTDVIHSCRLYRLDYCNAVVL